MTWQVIEADCVTAMREMEPESIDVVVTDPPYALSFMGKAWDSHGVGEDAAEGYWLAGLVDGEGHFRVNKARKGNCTCGFEMGLRQDDRATLERARRFLGVGTIADRPGRGEHKPTSVLSVQAKADCLRVVETFARYPLRSKKLRDFLGWAEAVVVWNEMKVGHRWSGRADWSRLEALKRSIERSRDYREPPWSGHPHQDASREWAEEALRVLKPGGHLLAFGGTRTYHRLACAVEDAGFEIRDSVIWLYGSGFPKSLDVSKAIDRAAGAERGPCSDFAPDYLHPDPEQQKVCTTCLYHEDDHAKGDHEGNINFGMKNRCGKCGKPFFSGNPCECPKPKAATPEAQRWQGWGTALKPAHEPIVVARKPLIGTVAQNVERFGTGAINVDACRIGYEQDGDAASNPKVRAERGCKQGHSSFSFDGSGGYMEKPPSPAGRWPANVALSHIGPDENGEGGCERVGERRVKGHAGYPNGPQGNQFSVGDEPDGTRQEPWQGHADPDGLETVEAWSCAPGCPVAELDRQSGERQAGAWPKGEQGKPDLYGDYKGFSRAERTELDSGGASRFFATFSGGSVAPSTGDGVEGAQAEGRADPLDEPCELHGIRGCTICTPRFRYVAKASRAERNAGLEGFEERWSPTMNDGIGGKEHSRPCSCDTFTEWVNEGQSPSTQADSATPPPRDTTALTLGDASGTSTTGSGSKSTGRSPQASTSTTSTGTSRTTESETLGSSTRSRTSEPTPRTTESGAGTGSDGATSAGSGSPPTLDIGISTETGGSSTGDAAPATSESSSSPSSSVSSGNRCPDCGGVVGGGRVASRANVHPLSTVKPVDLMRWLCRLVTPPDGLVLDPFAGSGTTGIACVLEDFDFIGIEREPDYVEIAKARIDYWAKQPKQLGLLDDIPPEKPKGRWPANVALSHLEGCELVGTRRVRSGNSQAEESTVSEVKGGLGGKISAHYADSDGLETIEDWRCVDGCPVAELDKQSRKT